MENIFPDNPMKDLSKDTDISREKILVNLLNAKNNLELKTEIHKPKELASLYSIAKYLKVHKYHKSYTTITSFIDIFLRYMISHNRMSRIEIIKALTPIESNVKDYMDTKFSTKID